MSLMVHRDAAVTAAPATRPVHPVTTMTIHPLALAMARELAGFDQRRVSVVDQRTVLVLNYPGQSWPAPRKPRKARA